MFDLQDPVPYGIISIIQKSSLIRNQSFGFFLFIDKFISQVYKLIYEEDFPRISQELQEILHPVAEQQIGDCILYKYFTMIKVYGAEKNPYKLPKFLTLKIFALDILRQQFD